MCNYFRKCLEWLAMLALWVYGSLTLIYIIAMSPLLFLFIYEKHESLDLLIGAMGLLVILAQYITSLACLTATVRLTEIADRLGFERAPLYRWVRIQSKNTRIFLLFCQFLQIQFTLVFRKQYKGGAEASEWYIEALRTVNFAQFVIQIAVTLMALVIFGLSIFSLTCRNGCAEDGEGNQSYDASNKDDIFAAFEERITELRHPYSKLKGKNNLIPAECAICFELFLQEITSDIDVIQLQCNKLHVFHEQCILDWFRYSRNCPLCREQNRHALPMQILSQTTENLETN